MTALSRLTELEQKHDGPIPRDELAATLYNSGNAAAQQVYLRFYKRDLKRSIEASKRYRQIAGGRYDSISEMERLARRARLCHGMIWSAKNYVSFLAQTETADEKRHDQSLAAE